MQFATTQQPDDHAPFRVLKARWPHIGRDMWIGLAARGYVHMIRIGGRRFFSLADCERIATNGTPGRFDEQGKRETSSQINRRIAKEIRTKWKAKKQ
ncbi:MAG: hypothetical protein AMXMBFR84_37460 [Candidatus Hydrogenedentota bacterium]